MTRSPLTRAGLAAMALLGLATWRLAGPAPAAPLPEAVRIRFAYQDRLVDAVPIIAVAKGYFEQEGLRVKASVFSSGPACSEAVLSGAADFGTMGDTTAVIAAARRAPVKLVASHGGGEHRHRILVGKTSAIRKAGDLVGKRLAVKKGTSTYGGLLAWAERHHLDLKRVQVTDLRPEDMPEALASGAVDAIVASEPTPSQVEAKGYGRELATLGKLGNTYPVLLVVRERFAQEHPEVLPRFLRAMRRGAQFIHDHPAEAARLVSKTSGLPEPVAKKAMARHQFAVRNDAALTRSLGLIAQFLQQQGTIDQAPDWTQAFVDPRLLKPASKTGAT